MSQETLNALFPVLMICSVVVTVLNFIITDMRDPLGKKIYPLGAIPALLIIHLAFDKVIEQGSSIADKGVVAAISFFFTLPALLIAGAALMICLMAATYALRNLMDSPAKDSKTKRKKKKKQKSRLPAFRYWLLWFSLHSLSCL